MQVIFRYEFRFDPQARLGRFTARLLLNKALKLYARLGSCGQIEYEEVWVADKRPGNFGAPGGRGHWCHVRCWVGWASESIDT
jgi:hypothetical protein